MKIMRAFVLTICLTACQGSWIAGVVTLPGQALYHEDFSNARSGWPQAIGSTNSMGYQAGAYQMVVQAPMSDLQAVSRQSYGDVQIEVDATRQAGPVYNRFGLICRYEDMNDFYFFAVSSDGYYAIGKIINGATSLLGQDMMAYSTFILQAGEPKHLRFDCIGNTLKGYVNGQVLAITDDADFSSGDAGFMIGSYDEGGVDISFDNFVVYKP
jgi:hypothetical protein